MEAVINLLEEAGKATDAQERIRLSPGEVLITEGQADNTVYVLLKGGLRVSRKLDGEQTPLILITRPGSVVGEIVAFGGGTRTATVEAQEASELLAFSPGEFDSLLESNPSVARELAKLAERRAEEGELAELLAAHFGITETETLAGIIAGVEWRRLDQGEVLFEEGDASDAIYFVVRGRLLASRFDSGEGGEVRLGEAGRGEVVGEMGLLRRAPRGATVTALRDTVLAALPEAGFLHLVEQRPRVMIEVGLKALERAEDTSRSSPSTVLAVAAAAGLDRRAITDGLVRGLESLGSVQRFSPSEVDTRLGMAGVSEVSPGEVGDVRVSRFLHEAEIATDHLVFDLGTVGGGWSRRCLGMADRALVFVPRRSDEADRALLDQVLGDCPRGLHRTVVVVHPPGSPPPSGSASQASRFGAQDVLHVMEGSGTDLERVARVAVGRGNALVLGGGGGRGFAHIGVLRAMSELGVPVDIVGGASIGGILAAAMADATPPEQVIEWAARHFPKSMDYTIPMVSLIKGARIARSADETFGSREIEDLWLTYFCVSTNLTASRLHIHRGGPLARAIRATSAIPGVMPPVPEGNDLLIDGGVINNLPIDVAREMAPAGKIVAVDVAPPRGPGARSDYGLSVSGWDALRTGWGNGRRVYPRISAVLMRSMITASMRERDRQVGAHLADCYLDLDMRGVSMLDFDDPVGVAQRGYEAAMPLLEAWLEASQDR